ncbi:MAG: M56 family metallopeptidase [Thermoanaerobaculia bacterium]
MTFLPRQEPRTAVNPSLSALSLGRKAAAGSSAAGEVIERAGVSRAGRFAAAGWTGVAVLLLAREALGHLALARLRRRWRPAPAALRRSLGWPAGVALYLDSHDGPFAAGVFRRAVVLPEPLLAGCAARTAEALARHELDHTRWRDPLANAALRIVRCTLWVSPALWLLERAVRAESEAAADRRAVESLAPADFASALVAVARWRQSRRAADGLGLLAAHAAHPGMLEQRVHRLLSPGQPFSGARRAPGRPRRPWRDWPPSRCCRSRPHRRIPRPAPRRGNTRPRSGCSAGAGCAARRHGRRPPPSTRSSRGCRDGTGGPATSRRSSSGSGPMAVSRP